MGRGEEERRRRGREERKQRGEEGERGGGREGGGCLTGKVPLLSAFGDHEL